MIREWLVPSGDHRRLRVWQEALKLTVAVTPVRDRLVAAGRGALAGQLDRAASSVQLNIAEGWGRASRADRRRILVIARGSLREVDACLAEVARTSAIPPALLAACRLHVLHTTRLLSALLRTLHP